MIQQTRYKLKKEILEEISKIEQNGKTSINDPTGNFFYDPWTIKPEFRNTALEYALSVLPGPIGEARLITLKSGTCYFSHSDIDDRYHLNITGDCAALINLETAQSWFLDNNGVWYDMDASYLHSAANYGQYDRTQLVVRKLLNNAKLTAPVCVKITPAGNNPRYVFDNTLSPWLNKLNKKELINEFSVNIDGVSFCIDCSAVKQLVDIIPNDFHYEIL